MQYLVLRSEHLFEEPLRFRETFLGEHHRLRLSNGIADVSLFVKPAHRQSKLFQVRHSSCVPRYRSASTARSIFSASAFIGASGEKFSRGILCDMDPKQIVHSDPEVVNGTPVFVGTRVPAQTLLDYLEGGETIEEFLDDFLSVSREQAIAFLEEAGRAFFKHLS